MDTVEHGAIAREKRDAAGTIASNADTDVEKNAVGPVVDSHTKRTFLFPLPAHTFLTDALPAGPATPLAPLRGLSFLDRFLVVWILVAMGAGVSVPIGEPAFFFPVCVWGCSSAKRRTT